MAVEQQDGLLIKWMGQPAQQECYYTNDGGCQPLHDDGREEGTRACEFYQECYVMICPGDIGVLVGYILILAFLCFSYLQVSVLPGWQYELKLFCM